MSKRESKADLALKLALKFGYIKIKPLEKKTLDVFKERRF